MMKPTYEVWLEIVRERMTQGDAAPVAIGKAQLVTNAYSLRFIGGATAEAIETVIKDEDTKAYAMRFEQKPDLNIKAQLAQAYLDQRLSELKREEELKEKHEQGPPFNPCSDAPSDPNTGES